MTETKTPSTPGPAEVWITGIGLATSLGEGLDTNWDALNARRINVDEKGFAPYIVHPWVPVNLDAQIPKKGDQRQMEAWQRIGTYAAGLALDSAGLKGNKEILGRMDMIVAAGGGERDLAVDSNILNLQAKGNSAPGFLNERLKNDLRPTPFLAQLSNLLAGNIAISVIVLLTTIYVRTPLEFSVFPTLLLATTLGRLRAVIKKWPPNRDAEDLLKETEALLAKKK